MLENQNKKPELIEDLGMKFPSQKCKQKVRFAIYRCGYCDKEFTTRTNNIKTRPYQGCGCLRGAKKTHGMKGTDIYNIWKTMRQRVSNQNSVNYKRYGARGIKVCQRWNKFENFYKDMGKNYKKGLSIDRINNDGDYEPNNCRWTDRKTQARNTRKLRSNNTSGYRGVSFKKENKRWQSAICENYKTIHIGYYDTALEAAKAYDQYVIDNKLEHTINFSGDK